MLLTYPEAVTILTFILLSALVVHYASKTFTGTVINTVLNLLSSAISVGTVVLALYYLFR